LGRLLLKRSQEDFEMKNLMALVAAALLATGCAAGEFDDGDPPADVPQTRNATVNVPTEEVEPNPNKPVSIREEGVYQNPLDPVIGTPIPVPTR
jgi:PBP1b-binding outer membrane lipoprotein LpoB